MTKHSHHQVSGAGRGRREPAALTLAAFGVLAIACASLFVGVGDVGVGAILSGAPDTIGVDLLLVSRLPRTLALILAGMQVAIAGTLMQTMVRNRFVDPATTGIAESAGLGMLCVLLFAPNASVFERMAAAALSAIAGTALFLAIVKRIALRTVVIVPLIGIVLSGIIRAITVFLAYRYDLLQSVVAWMAGDFSPVLRGRYELLWVSCGFSAIAYVAADRFTLALMGQEFATNLGLNYQRIVVLGLFITSVMTAMVVATVGVIPFVGLIVPNLVSDAVGENARRSLPWTALLGVGLVLICDITGRLVRYPYEVPIGAVIGVVGSAVFLWQLLRKGAWLA